jgi:hypothetical protein
MAAPVGADDTVPQGRRNHSPVRDKKNKGYLLTSTELANECIKLLFKALDYESRRRK